MSQSTTHTKKTKLTKTLVILSIVLLPLIGVTSAVLIWDIRIITGHVEYFSIGGGSYGIVDRNEKIYHPINLPEYFRVDGMKILVFGKIRYDLGTYGDPGQPFEGWVYLEL